jgi:hypothetical protein
MNNLPTVRASDWLNKVPEVAVVLDHQDHVHHGGRDRGRLPGGQRGLWPGLTRTVMAAAGSRLFMQLRTRRYTLGFTG